VWHRPDHRATGRANRAALERMKDAMVHRGPDASGTWVSAPDARGWGTLLVHCRLSILDHSPAGAQPTTDPVTGHVEVFNGEIYNVGDLRRRLVAEGQEFNSTGEAAVMLRTLGLYGPGAVSWFAWHVRVRLLGPEAAPAPAREGSSGHQATWHEPQAVASGVWNGFVVGPGTAQPGASTSLTGRQIEFDGADKEIRDEDFWFIPTAPPIRPRAPGSGHESKGDRCRGLKLGSFEIEASASPVAVQMLKTLRWIRWSANRKASATAVKVGLAKPEVGKIAAPVTNNP
jgi:hypothetical protein